MSIGLSVLVFLRTKVMRFLRLGLAQGTGKIVTKKMRVSS